MAREEKTKRDKFIGWKDRHAEIKRLKNNTKRTWLHLVIGEHKLTNKKVLRLLKPFNYLSIPDKETYKKIVTLLSLGGDEIGWLDRQTQEKLLDLQKNIKEKISAVSDKQKKGGSLSEDEQEILEAIRELQLESKTVSDLIQKMQGATEADVQKTSKLLSEINLHDLNNFADIVKTRIEKLDFFRKIAKDPKTYEIRGKDSIHRFLENNMWVLDERYWLMHSNQQLRTIVGEKIEKDPNKRPDFVCGQVGNKLIIVELKRPSRSLQVKDFDQLENYMKIIEKHFTDYSDYEGYLVGHEISDDLKDTIKYRSPKFKVKTYTDFISDAEKRYQEFR